MRFEVKADSGARSGAYLRYVSIAAQDLTPNSGLSRQFRVCPDRLPSPPTCQTQIRPLSWLAARNGKCNDNPEQNKSGILASNLSLSRKKVETPRSPILFPNNTDSQKISTVQKMRVSYFFRKKKENEFYDNALRLSFGLTPMGGLWMLEEVLDATGNPNTVSKIKDFNNTKIDKPLMLSTYLINTHMQYMKYVPLINLLPSVTFCIKALFTIFNKIHTVLSLGFIEFNSGINKIHRAMNTVKCFLIDFPENIKTFLYQDIANTMILHFILGFVFPVIRIYWLSPIAIALSFILMKALTKGICLLRDWISKKQEAIMELCTHDAKILAWMAQCFTQEKTYECSTKRCTEPEEQESMPAVCRFA